MILILLAGCTGNSKEAVQTTNPPAEEAPPPTSIPKAEPLKIVNTTQKLLGIEDFPEVLELKKLESSQAPATNASTVELVSNEMNVTNRINVYPSLSYAIFGGYGQATHEGFVEKMFDGPPDEIKHETFGDDSRIYAGQKDSAFVYYIVIRKTIMVSRITIVSLEELEPDRLLEIGERSLGKLEL